MGRHGIIHTLGQVGDAQPKRSAAKIHDPGPELVAGGNWEAYDLISSVRVHLKPHIVLLAAWRPVLFRANLLHGAVRVAVNPHP